MFIALNCVSMSNQGRVRPIIVYLNSNEPLFYPYSITVNKCSGICSDINNPDSELCIHDVVKDMNIKLMKHALYQSIKLVHVTVD